MARHVLRRLPFVVWLGSVALAQQPENWSLRLPTTPVVVQAGDGPGFATHPTTGRLVQLSSLPGSTGVPFHVWEWSGSSWLRHVGSPSPEPRTGPMLANDTVRRELVLFGGASAQRETWTWDGVHWQAHPTPPLLTMRSDGAMAFDALRGRAVLFGGGVGGLELGDTWEWDGAAWTLRQPGAPPAPRVGHRMAFDAGRGCVVLFGGITDGTLWNDTWQWDGTYWFQRFPSNPPPGRHQHGLCSDPVRQRIVLSGGVGATPVPGGLADTWEWDGSDWTLVATSHSPVTHLRTALEFDRTRNRVVMFGATDSFEEVWDYDGTDWTPVARGLAPSARSSAAMVDDPPRGNLVLFGGQSGSTVRDDTWTWDGHRWQPAAPALAPAARFGHAVAFDVARGVPTLFGGSSYSGSLTVFQDDTWTWNGTTWTVGASPTRPSARCHHGLAWHAASQRIVLFGGNDGLTVYGDTWTWDGATWSQQSPSVSPAARFQTAMAGLGQDVVLFGGGVWVTSSHQTASRNDTWTWNGSTWQQVLTPQSPPSRYQHFLVGDPGRNRVLLHGGSPASTAPGAFDDLWAFDGGSWTPITTAVRPFGNSGVAMAYDSRLHQVLRFDSARATWILVPGAEVATFGSGCPGALGVPVQQPAPESRPEPGGAVEIDVTNLPASIALLAMGFSNTTAGLLPLPLTLAPYGMPGCELRVAPQATRLLLGAGGTARWTLPVPFSPSLFGVAFYHQVFAYDPTANAAGLSTSAGGRVRIGN